MDRSFGRHVWLTRYVPLIIWTGVIFFLSSSQGSLNQTSRIIRPILEFLFPDASTDTISFYHGIIRKLAHFTEYAVLGILACRALAASALSNRTYLYTAVFVLLIAAIDETNQSFNPARTGSAIDVLIDVSGGIIAIGALFLLNRRRASRI